MTTIQMATPVTAEADATREAQEARWTTWKSNAATDDRITQRRVRLAFGVVLIVFVCVTLAVLLWRAPVCQQEEETIMVTRPAHFNPYEFAVVSGLRAHQLMDGCLPQIDGEHNATMMAQMEVASGKIARIDAVDLPQKNPVY